MGFSLQTLGSVCSVVAAVWTLQSPSFSSCGARTYRPIAMWDFPRSGIERVSPALAGRFTAPPRRSPYLCFKARSLRSREVKQLIWFQSDPSSTMIYSFLSFSHHKSAWISHFLWITAHRSLLFWKSHYLILFTSHFSPLLCCQEAGSYLLSISTVLSPQIWCLSPPLYWTCSLECHQGLPHC